jgi:hypothetical protein
VKEREKRKLKDGAGVEQRVPTRCGQLDSHLDSLLAIGRTWKRSHVYAQNTRFLQYEVHDMILAKLRVMSLHFSTLCKTTADIHFVLFMPTTSQQLILIGRVVDEHEHLVRSYKTN